jgi:hypothetical protein
MVLLVILKSDQKNRLKLIIHGTNGLKHLKIILSLINNLSVFHKSVFKDKIKDHYLRIHMIVLFMNPSRTSS